MRFIRTQFDIDAQMVGNESADFVNLKNVLSRPSEPPNLQQSDTKGLSQQPMTLHENCMSVAVITREEH